MSNLRLAPAGEFRIDSRLIAWTLWFAARSRKRVYAHRKWPRARPAIPKVLRLIARGLSNQEFGQRLFLALDMVKGTTAATSTNFWFASHDKLG
jgi:hypothetical protein